jgi:predicted ferric reductase
MLVWYLARGAGIAAYLMLSVATGVGALSSRRIGSAQRRTLLQYVHRSAAASGLALIGLHVAMLLADSFAHVGVVGLLPFGSSYRPLAVTLGVLALYLLLAVSATGMLRSRLASSQRASRLWRRIHLAAYLAWGLSALHFLSSGSDAGRWWALFVLFAGVGIVGVGVIARVAGLAAGGVADAPGARTSERTLIRSHETVLK